MGLNDRKNVVADCIKERDGVVSFLAKKNWNQVCEIFNDPEENFANLDGDDKAEIFIDFEFSYSGMINGEDTPLGVEELVGEMKKSFPKDYQYFAPLIYGGVLSEEIEFVPTKMFRPGHAKFKVEKSQILCDIEKKIKELAATENVTLEVRYFKMMEGNYSPFNSKPFTEFYLADFKKEDRTSRFIATLRVTRR